MTKWIKTNFRLKGEIKRHLRPKAECISQWSQYEDKKNGESAKDEVKDESQDEDPQIKNENDTEQSTPDNNEAKLKQNKEDPDLKDIDKTKSWKISISFPYWSKPADLLI